MSTGSAGRRPLLVAGMLAGALALVTACGSPASSGSAAGTTTSAAAASQASGTQVTATLTEFHISLSQSSFTPGSYTFVAKNSGSTTHALEITGPGVAGQHTADLSPGSSADLTVTLSAGSYEVFCPVDGHKDLGMDLHITVGGAGAGAPATTSAAPMTTASQGGSGGYGNGY